MNVLVACEESQAVCLAFRKLGHNAYSCDLKECSGGFPQYHVVGDMFSVIEKAKNGLPITLQDGSQTVIEGGGFDLMIAHPPCTFLSVSGARWYYHPDDKDLPYEERRPHPKYPNRRKDQEDAINFFLKVANCDIDRIAIENPIGVMSTKWKKPNQIIHPWMFGDEASKATCLWLKNLPELVPTNIVGKGEQVVFSSGKTMAKWISDCFKLSKEERQTMRSKTFQGIADAMAEQWGNFK